MLFNAASILAFAALASTAAVRRADYGFWDFSGSVSFPASGYLSYGVDATYTNSQLAAPIEVTCSYLYNPQTKTETASCSDPSFTYDFGGVRMANTISTVTLTQTVELDGSPVTVTGAQEFDWDFSSGSGRSGIAKGPIAAQTATA
ncbi:hypothetical protein HER10_EVM0012346 [Colletotrichum scovillei]|uniref:Uncharacterized protein n=1 Tax=Colletotrichum scovillei TaxID=1209932 RepID=A0A9P7QZY8_9PEZI|nr:uncharacterized protein HER10_EVM0012346 [Colletotrichum scovillei]KAF4781476.1 hypothetical protein HER10_EVM0012346 [Colletotrichum scovillei]KAG7045285.1 hypothetical protein JMJ77_0009369 [Colletotrichum scovillei]KAG7052449.1 hypothetical protein JMJ78_0005466 [Colletotrichum scovillei]KAG7064737.1 hypothetical protein JMJ76_0012496 [Colletotrichum scovillei]